MSTQTTQRRRGRGDAGETLLEVLIALVILGGAIAALVGGLSTAILSSGRHREQATANNLLRSYAEALKQTARDGYNCTGTAYTVSSDRYVTPAGWNAGNTCSGANPGTQQVTVFACPPRVTSCSTAAAPFRLDVWVRVP